MAAPIPLDLPPRDPRTELQTRLQNAPMEHAEALLSAYEVLQGMHDRGVFDLLRGALGSSDKVTEILLETAKSPEAIRGLRNLIILSKTLGTIDPAVMEAFAKSLPEAVARLQAEPAKPAGLWDLLKQFRDQNFRKGLQVVNTVLETVGKNFPKR